ncbi:MAG: alpha/beta fold hydrolase [Candidatus Heimdallarchaeota archaeon]|nr:alpha/beta fold hydrolase [Candidatus Heimdallarchaeota archaeon]
MEKKITFGIIVLVSSAMILTGFIGMLTINSVMWNNQTIRFTDSFGNTIYNKYYPGEISKGVMLFHGFGEDLTSMRAIANDLIRNNFHVFATDFSGHGQSSGVLGGGNSTHSPLIDQVLLAKEKFKDITGLFDSEIILVGHSMGAGAILQAATKDTNNVSSLILLGGAAQIPENSTGSWVDDLGPTNPAANVQIITGTWEDILTPDEAMKVYNKLSNSSEILSKDEIYYTTNSSEGFNYELWVLPRQVHSYEPISARVSNLILQFCLWEGNPHIAISLNSINEYRVIFLPLLTVGLIVSTLFGIFFISVFDAKNQQNIVTNQIKIISMKKFLGFKPLIWIGSYIFGIIPALIIFPIPVGKPYFTFIYLIPFFGYGIFMLILNLLGKIPGAEGSWKPNLKSSFNDLNWIRLLLAVVLCIVLTLLSAFLITSSLYHIFPANVRLLWLFIFVILCPIGFYFVLRDSELIRINYQQETNKTKTYYNLQILLNYTILYVPFILAVIFIGASGTLIYFFDGLHSLTIILFVLLSGELLNKIIKKPALVAIFQSFLLFFLLTPRGPITTTFF